MADFATALEVLKSHGFKFVSLTKIGYEAYRCVIRAGELGANGLSTCYEGTHSSDPIRSIYRALEVAETAGRAPTAEDLLS